MRRPSIQLKLFFYAEIVNREKARLKRAERARLHEAIKAAQEERRMTALVTEVQLQLTFDRINITEAYNQHYNALMIHALKLAQNRTDAEDLVQETFLRAAEMAHTYREHGKPKAWLFRIMQNLYFGKYQEGKKMPTDYQEDNFLLEGSENNRVFDELMRDDAVKALNNLPLIIGSVAKLYFIDQLKYGQIAVRLNLPLGTVKCRIHMARKELQRILIEYQK